MVYQILIESRRTDFLIVIGYCLIVHQQESYFFVFMENDYPWGENPLIRFVIISVGSFFFFFFSPLLICIQPRDWQFIRESTILALRGQKWSVRQITSF